MEISYFFSMISTMKVLKELKVIIEGNDFPLSAKMDIVELKIFRESLPKWKLEKFSILSRGIPCIVLSQIGVMLDEAKEIEIVVDRDNHSLFDQRDAICLYQSLKKLKKLVRFKIRASMFLDSRNILLKLPIKKNCILSY